MNGIRCLPAWSQCIQAQLPQISLFNGRISIQICEKAHVEHQRTPIVSRIAQISYTLFEESTLSSIGSHCSWDYRL